jgi:hypothetical protein
VRRTKVSSAAVYSRCRRALAAPLKHFIQPVNPLGFMFILDKMRVFYLDST